MKTVFCPRTHGDRLRARQAGGKCSRTRSCSAVSFQPVRRRAPHSWGSLLEPRISFSKESLGLAAPHTKAYITRVFSASVHVALSLSTADSVRAFSNLFLRWIECANNVVRYVHAFICAHLAVTKSLTCVSTTGLSQR